MSQEITMKLDRMIEQNKASREGNAEKRELTQIRFGIAVAVLMLVALIGVFIAFYISFAPKHFDLPSLFVEDHYPTRPLVKRGANGYELYVYVDEERAHYPQGF